MTMKSIEELNKELLDKGLIAIIDGGIYSRVPEDELSKHIASFYGISIEELKNEMKTLSKWLKSSHTNLNVNHKWSK